MCEKVTSPSKAYTIVIPLYNGVDYMDIAAPREVFSWINDKKPDNMTVTIVYAAATMDPIATRDGTRILPERQFGDMSSANLLWVPGGILKEVMKDAIFTAFLLKIAEKADWVCSVCEGALILAESGLLDGHRATTHWAFYRCLQAYKNVTVVDGYPRFVQSGNRMTGGGISAAIDEAFELVRLICGEDIAKEIKMSLQYFPEPIPSKPLPSDPPPCPLKS